MKNLKAFLAVVLALACLFSFAACGSKTAETADTSAETTADEAAVAEETEETEAAEETAEEPEEAAEEAGEEPAEEEAPAAVEAAGLWETAAYLTDTEFGEGARTVVVEVSAEDQTVTFTIHTDADTVGAALLENDLIAGEESEYGLYVKTVNGMLADYDVDQSYWAFYIDGEYAMTGVDATEIAEGSVYALTYTK